MQIEIERKFTSKGFLLSSKTHPFLTGHMNISLRIMRRQLTVRDVDSKTTYELKQQSRLQKLLSCLPLGNLYPRPHYDFYKNGYHRGHTKSTRFLSQSLLFDFADTYEMFRHGENYISILRNGEQVALLQRDPHMYNECAKYTGHFHAKMIDPAILMLCIEYMDVTCFPMRGWSTMSIRKYRFVPREPFHERVTWKVSDEEVL